VDHSSSSPLRRQRRARPRWYIIKRTSKAFRFDWSTIALPIPLAAAGLRRVAEAALHGAAKVCRQSGFKVTYHRRKQYIVIWVPLSRKGDTTIGRLTAALTALWSEALKLNTESGNAFTLLNEAKTEESKNEVT
jgi:hypothetical protein